MQQTDQNSQPQLDLVAYNYNHHAHKYIAGQDSGHTSGHRHHTPEHTPGKHQDKPAAAKEPAQVADADGIIGPRRLPSEHGFVQAMKVYWQQLTTAKSHHHLYNAYPPVYSGMDDSRIVKTDPTGPQTESYKSHGKLPSLNDLNAASKDLNRIVAHDKTKPDFNVFQVNEQDFKKRYAAECILVGRNYGLDVPHVANLVKRIYAFEDGGWGTHDTLSSMPQGLMDPAQKEAKMNFHPSSSAMGYNQLLIKNTTNGIIDHGDAIADRLEVLAKNNPNRAAELHQKAELIHGIRDVLTHHSNIPAHKKGDKNRPYYVPDSKLETAIQGLNLDGDIGPIIQSQELNSLLKFSAANKFGDYLSLKTAEHTTHAREYDALPDAKKAAAVDQIFALVRPPEVHPNNPALDAPFYKTKEALRQKFADLGKDGVDHRLERENLPDEQFRMMNAQVLTIRRYGGAGGPLSPEARALLDRATSDYFGGFSADKLEAAAIEMANLSGMSTAQMMLKAENSNLPTSNFFAKDGYQGNPVTSRRSADELLLQIMRIMRGPNSEQTKIGNSEFDAAFNSFEPHPHGPH